MQYHLALLIIYAGDSMIADRIKFLREQQKMTQTELSKRLGITRSSVNAWEIGISVPSTQYIVEIAAIFKVSTDYLLGVSATVTLPVADLSEQDVHMVYQLLDYIRKKNANN